MRRWRTGPFTLVVSEHILAELTATSNEPYFTNRLSTAEIGAALGAVRSGATMQPITIMVAGVVTHAEDELISATAVSAHPTNL